MTGETQWGRVRGPTSGTTDGKDHEDFRLLQSEIGSRKVFIEFLDYSAGRCPTLDSCTGLGLVAQIMFGSGPGSDDSNRTLYRTFRAFSGHSFFRKENAIRSCAHLMLVTQSGSGNKSHRLNFLGDFRSCPLPPYKLDIRYLCTVPQTSR
jgi:hypothetical protein